MLYEKVREELTHIHRKVAEKGYTQASGGNISCRVPGEPDRFAIKRTAVNMCEMMPQDVIIVDGQGRVVDGEGTPSKEINFHLGLMHLRPEVNAVVHCHPNHAIAFANCGITLPLTTITARKVAGLVPCIGTEPAGSEALRDLVITAFRENPAIRAILMKEHGICTVGASLLAAYNVADMIEQTAHQAILVAQVAQNRALFEGRGGVQWID